MIPAPVRINSPDRVLNMIQDSVHQSLDKLRTSAQMKSWVLDALALYPGVFTVPRPGFYCASTDSILVQATEARPRFFLIGEELLTTTTPLTCLLDASHLDPGSTKKANTVYYLYAVSRAGNPKLVASERDPSIGLATKEDSTYLGGFRSTTGGAIYPFQSNKGLCISEQIETDVTFNSSAFTAGVLRIPVTATAVYARAVWSAVAAAGDTLGIGSDATYGHLVATAQSTTVGNNAVSHFWVQIVTPQTIYGFTTNTTTDAVGVKSFGWVEDPEAYR